MGPLEALEPGNTGLTRGQDRPGPAQRLGMARPQVSRRSFFKRRTRALGLTVENSPGRRRQA